MRIIHRIGLRASDGQCRDLRALGVDVGAGLTLSGGEPLRAFDVDEAHANWSTISKLLELWGASDVTRTEFTNEEIHSADWLEISAWHCGYPQPDDGGFGFRAATYDTSGLCEQCGVGMKQSSPFQMKREPRWGRNSVMQLHWVYDEIFMTPKLWSTVFEPLGVGCRPVMGMDRNALTSVVQLVITEIVSLQSDGLNLVPCGHCSRSKCMPVVRGAFPALHGAPRLPVARTSEWFGSGAEASRRILVSSAVARRLIDVGCRGASFRPVAAR